MASMDSKPQTPPPQQPAVATPDAESTPPRRRRRSSTASSTHSRSSSASSFTTRLLPVEPAPYHPANVYRNLLIMEESLRTEYVQLRFTRRIYTIFFLCLIAGTVVLSYYVFLNPSIYRGVHFFNRLGLMILLVTIVLFYISGSYSTTLVHSRRFIHNTNKGLHTFNVKLVKIPPTWLESLVDLVWAPAYASRPGRVVKLVLSPRAFNPDTIEGWEIYRQEYWNREYERCKRFKAKKKTAMTTTATDSDSIGSPLSTLATGSPASKGMHKRADSRALRAARTLRGSVDLGLQQNEVTPPRPRRKTIQKSSPLAMEDTNSSGPCRPVTPTPDSMAEGSAVDSAPPASPTRMVNPAKS